MTTLQKFHPDAPPARALREQLFAEVFAHEVRRRPRRDEVAAFLRDDQVAHLVEPHGTFVVALVGEQAVGCAGLRHHGVGVPDDAAEVKRMFVQPHARGRGIAGLLLEHLTDLARDANHRRLVLDTRDELTTAINLYQRRGFTPTVAYNTNPSATSWWEKPLRP